MLFFTSLEWLNENVYEHYIALVCTCKYMPTLTWLVIVVYSNGDWLGFGHHSCSVHIKG